MCRKQRKKNSSTVSPSAIEPNAVIESTVEMLLEVPRGLRNIRIRNSTVGAIIVFVLHCELKSIFCVVVLHTVEAGNRLWPRRALKPSYENCVEF